MTISFGGDLEEHRMPEDYRTGEYAAIAIEQVKQVKDGKRTIKGRRITVTQDQEELYDLIEESEKFLHDSADQLCRTVTKE